jgi:UDP-N-acetylmuramoylalanine--D-glutamate ligase
MAAAAVCLARGVPVEAVRQGLATFGGVAHRMEEVARRDGVLYVNDSKATNVASAVVALASFPPGTVHAILGGRGKGSDYRPLARAVSTSARAAYLIGEAAAEIRAALEADAAEPREEAGDGTGASPPGGVEIVEAGDLASAVSAARAAARPGDVVLLSPACASYDQHRSFEERGDHFRALVARE